jgi:hypothetical protein
MADNNTFSGTWHCRYWYPSNTHDGNDVSEYDMEAVPHGREIVLESQPNAEKSYMLVRLILDSDLATGTWYEETSPTGEFQGATYSGAGQLILNSDKTRFDGKWAGLGYDHDRKETRVYSGKWEIVRTDK